VSVAAAQCDRCDLQYSPMSSFASNSTESSLSRGRSLTTLKMRSSDFDVMSITSIGIPKSTGYSIRNASITEGNGSRFLGDDQNFMFKLNEMFLKNNRFTLIHFYLCYMYLLGVWLAIGFRRKRAKGLFLILRL